jgi:hypothetical protein
MDEASTASLTRNMERNMYYITVCRGGGETKLLL